METWSALDWDAGIVGQRPESMISKKDESGNGMTVLYSTADGRYLGRLVVAGPMAHLDPSEPEGGYYDTVFEDADCKFYRPDERIQATTRVEV
jgi:hypothetical protein